MHSGEPRKTANHGVLCGLGTKTSPDSDSSRSPSPDQENQLPPMLSSRKRPMDNTDRSQAQPRPQSLTLPFENRQRESHLVTEEEFDRIIRQEEKNNPLPLTGPGMRPNIPQQSMRRSISTRRTVATGRQRPVSADFSRLLAHQDVETQSGRPSLNLLSRDPTLTALPRPPTKNDLAVYPDQAPQNKYKSLRQRALTSATTASANIGTDTSPAPSMQNKHKRHLSAALMFENARKRLRMGSDASVTIPPTHNPHSPATPQAQFEGHPAVRPHQQPSIQPDTASRRSTDTEIQAHITSNPINHPSIPASTGTPRKTVLSRTWSKAKYHAAKLLPASDSESDTKHHPQISSPIIGIPDRPPTSLSYHTVASTSASTSTTQYYASAEHSPANPQYEYVSGPVPRKPLLNRLGAPPSKTQLNTVVARQQSRIQDLTLQNNVLVNQIALLRDEVQGLKVTGPGPGSGPGSSSSQKTGNNVDSGNEAGSEGTVRNKAIRNSEVRSARSGRYLGGYDVPDADGRHTLVRRRGNRIERDTSGGMIGSELRRDPDGWRHIVGESMDLDEEQAVWNGDDRRKTWMTCDS